MVKTLLFNFVIFNIYLYSLYFIIKNKKFFYMILNLIEKLLFIFKKLVEIF